MILELIKPTIKPHDEIPFISHLKRKCYGFYQSMQPPTTTHNHPQLPTTTHNYPQPSTTTCNHPQPPTTIDNHPQPPTSHNYPQPPKKLPTIIHNHPQPSKTTRNHPKITQKNQDLSQTLMLPHFRYWYWNRRWVLIVIRNNGIYLIVIRNNGIYIYMCACLREYTLQVITLTTFWLGWLFVFLSIKSNSFDVRSDDFYLLKIWIYELLLININQSSVQQSTISIYSWTTLWVFKNTEQVQRKFLL